MFFVSQTVGGREPRFGKGARDGSKTPAYPQAVKKELSGGDLVDAGTADGELDPKDAIIAELRRQVAELQSALTAKAAGKGEEGEEGAEGEGADGDGGGADAGDGLPEEAVDENSPEAAAQKLAAEYAEKIGSMELAELMAHLEARGGDLSGCMTMSEGEAESRCAELMQAMSVAELCELAKSQSLSIDDCLAVDRNALVKLAASAMSVDPDTLEHMSEKELIGTLEELGVDPAEHYDKTKVIEKLTKGRGLKRLLELFEVLGVDVTGIMDMGKLLALGAKLGPPKDGEGAPDGEEGDQGVDEATKPKPKIGDPDWVPSAKKQELQPKDPVKALQKLRNDARADWSVMYIEDSSIGNEDSSMSLQ